MVFQLVRTRSAKKHETNPPGFSHELFSGKESLQRSRADASQRLLSSRFGADGIIDVHLALTHCFLHKNACDFRIAHVVVTHWREFCDDQHG